LIDHARNIDERMLHRKTARMESKSASAGRPRPVSFRPSSAATQSAAWRTSGLAWRSCA
jgi:hypothetical protein